MQTRKSSQSDLSKELMIQKFYMQPESSAQEDNQQMMPFDMQAEELTRERANSQDTQTKDFSFI